MGFLAASWTLPIQRADVIGQHVKYWKCLSLDGTWYCQSLQRLSLYLREAHQGNSTHLTQTFDIGKSNDFIAVTLISCCWVSSSHGCGPSKIPHLIYIYILFIYIYIYLYIFLYIQYLYCIYCIYCIQVCGLRCSRGVSEGRSNIGPTPWSAYIKQPSTHGIPKHSRCQTCHQQKSESLTHQDQRTMNIVKHRVSGEVSRLGMAIQTHIKSDIKPRPPVSHNRIFESALEAACEALRGSPKISKVQSHDFVENSLLEKKQRLNKFRPSLAKKISENRWLYVWTTKTLKPLCRKLNRPGGPDCVSCRQARRIFWGVIPLRSWCALQQTCWHWFNAWDTWRRLAKLNSKWDNLNAVQLRPAARILTACSKPPCSDSLLISSMTSSCSGIKGTHHKSKAFPVP